MASTGITFAVERPAGCDYVRSNLPAALAIYGATRDDTMAEDALSLNIWTAVIDPEDRRPVMVRIHGGGLRIGQASHPMYNGVRPAERGVVVVTVN